MLQLFSRISGINEYDLLKYETYYETCHLRGSINSNTKPKMWKSKHFLEPLGSGYILKWNVKPKILVI